MGKGLVMWAVGRLRLKYPKVKLIMIYGNHDHKRAFYLGEVLTESFKTIPQVEIDNRPLERKYFQWGKTGFAYTHGKGVKTKDLAALCQNEAREIWGRTTRFEMHLGHLHQDIVKTLGGVICRWIPALCPPDAWHSSNGYVMSEKAAMALIYYHQGMTSLVVHYPDQKHFL
jgi:predicted phosphodiesterase